MQWRAIQGYEGYYEVSDSGLVRSLDRIIPEARFGQRRVRGRMMKLTVNSDRYMVVNLRKNGTTYVAFVHRLVAQAFIPNPYHYPVVNHINGNKQNNEVSNLEWATYTENNIHALLNYLRQPRGTMIAMVTECGYIERLFRSSYEAARITGISHSMISRCLLERTKTAGGVHWVKFAECNDYSFDGGSVDDELPYGAREQYFY